MDAQAQSTFVLAVAFIGALVFGLAGLLAVKLDNLAILIVSMLVYVVSVLVFGVVVFS